MPPKRTRRVRTMLLVAVAVAVLAAGGLTWRLLSGDDAEAAPEQGHPLTEARAAELAELATSGDEQQLREAFVLPAEQPLDPGLAAGLAGVDLVIDMSSYAATAEDTARVEATITDAEGTSTDWSLALLLTDAGWQIVHTVPRDEVDG